MKQLLERQLKWYFCIIVILTCLNLETQAIAQPLPSSDVVPLSQKSDNSLSPTNSARELFRKAYENRYTWDTQFPGYTAAIEVKHNQENYKGRVRVNPDLSVEVTGIEKADARQVIENQLSMLITHRRRVPFEVAHKNSSFKLGSTDKTGAVEIFEQADKTQAHYKVFQQQLLQVNRFLGKNAVTVDTLNSEITPFGYLATRYRATFRQSQAKQVLGVEEYFDSYKKVGSYYLPTRQVTQEFQEGRLTDTTESSFTDIQLLSGNG